jgi:hypothetical protein
MYFIFIYKTYLLTADADRSFITIKPIIQEFRARENSSCVVVEPII